MKVLLLAQHYAPEEVSGAVLVTELAEDLARRGHQVSFVTTAPSYPAGVVFPGYRNGWLQRELRCGVKVLRTWSYISPSKGFWARILNFGTFSITALFGGLAAGRPDVILSYSPPLPLGLAAWLLSLIWGVPWVLRVEDLFPDAAVAAGVLRNTAAIRLFQWLERFLYRRAKHISLISEGFRRSLLSKGIPAGKLSVIPVWSNPDEIQPLPKENEFRRRYGLQGCFVVLYAGNLGYNSALEDVLDAAGRLRETGLVSFVIVGEGVRKADLQAQAARLHLSNVLFLPFQPRQALPEMLAAADVGLVTLNARSHATSLPSKTFAIMSSARPILAITPENSEITQLLEQHGCGVSVPPDQPEQLALVIEKMVAGDYSLNLMGEAGREVLLRKYSREVCLDFFDRLLSNQAFVVG